MVCELRRIAVDSAAPAALARFWATLLDRPTTIREDAVSLSICERVEVVFRAGAEPKRAKNRLHFDLASTSPDHQVSLVQRAQRLGARPVDIGQADTPWMVLADPEGNEFCVLEPRAEYLGNGPVAALVVDAADPPALAEFWSQATGLPLTRAHPDYATVPREAGFWLEFVRVTEPKRVGNRIRLELVAPAGDQRAAEVARLEELGAVVGDSSSGAPALTDPEGNAFCVLRTLVAP